MADSIRKVDCFYIEVPDKPGEGTRILEGLKKAGVNMLAFCGFPTTESRSQLDVVPENAEAFRKAAVGLGLKLSDRKQAFLVRGDDRVGACADVYGKLSAQGSNVTAAQATTAGSWRWGMILWVKPADFERAGRALGV
jgi:hypothetical protein